MGEILTEYRAVRIKGIFIITCFYIDVAHFSNVHLLHEIIVITKVIPLHECFRSSKPNPWIKR